MLANTIIIHINIKVKDRKFANNGLSIKFDSYIFIVTCFSKLHHARQQ